MAIHYGNYSESLKQDADGVQIIGSDGQFIEDNVFSDWLYPQQKEMRQMGQQLIMDRLEPEERMEGLKVAGINPLTAAAGIAGTTSNSPTPASSVNPVGDVAGAVGSVSTAGSDVVSAIDTISSMGVRAENLRSDTIANLEKAGLDHWNAVSIAETLPGLKSNQRADYFLKLSQMDVLKAEYQNKLAEHNNIIASYDEIISRTNVNVSLADKQVAEKAKIEEETRFQKEINDFFASYGYDPRSPLDVSLRNCVVTGNGDPNTLGKVIEYNSYKESRGEARASWESRPSTVTEAAFSGLDEAKKRTIWQSLKDALDGIGDIPTGIADDILKQIFPSYYE